MQPLNLPLKVNPLHLQMDDEMHGRCPCYTTQMPAFISTVLLRLNSYLHHRLSRIQSVSIRRDKHLKLTLKPVKEERVRVHLFVQSG